MIEKAQDWRWSSLWIRTFGNKQQKALLSPWPMEKPRTYLHWVNELQKNEEERLKQIRYSIQRGKPFGKESWIKHTAEKLGLLSTLRKRGRPKKGTCPLFLTWKIMKPFKVSPAKDITVRFSNQEVELPSEIQSKIDQYWDELIDSGKPYKRGEVFTVTHKETRGDTIDILVEKTDYAHYLYCQNVELLEEHGVHIIHTAALVETSDRHYIFGEMGPQTSRHGIVQLCGGGIDNDDLKGEYFDFKHNITKELQEELDINVEDAHRVAYFDEAYLKEGGPTDKMTVVFRVVLNETKDEFLKKYNGFVVELKTKGEDPEFGKIIALKKNKQEIESFFSQSDLKLDEYMKPLFEEIQINL